MEEFGEHNGDLKIKPEEFKLKTWGIYKCSYCTKEHLIANEDKLKLANTTFRQKDLEPKLQNAYYTLNQ